MFLGQESTKDRGCWKGEPRTTRRGDFLSMVCYDVCLSLFFKYLQVNLWHQRRVFEFNASKPSVFFSWILNRYQVMSELLFMLVCPSNNVICSITVTPAEQAPMSNPPNVLCFACNTSWQSLKVRETDTAGFTDWLNPWNLGDTAAYMIYCKIHSKLYICIYICICILYII